MQLLVDDRRRRIRSHAAGVRSSIAIVAPLVILRGRQGNALLVVRHHNEADFFALEEFLDHDGAAGCAETSAEHFAAHLNGRRVRVAYLHALAGSQAIRLDHQRPGIRVRLVLVKRRRGRKSLVNAFEPPSWAALRDGPKQRRWAAVKRSTMPATKGTSGPTMVSAISSSIANLSNASMSSTAMSTLRTLGSKAVPALPGATKTCSTRGEDAHFHA